MGDSEWLTGQPSAPAKRALPLSVRSEASKSGGLVGLAMASGTMGFNRRAGLKYAARERRPPSPTWKSAGALDRAQLPQLVEQGQQRQAENGEVIARDLAEQVNAQPFQPVGANRA